MDRARADLLRLAQKGITDGENLPRLALGVTEKGEPWCSLYCPKTGEAVGHFARIGGTYISIHGCAPAISSADLRAMVEGFILGWRARRNAGPT